MRPYPRGSASSPLPKMVPATREAFAALLEEDHLPVVYADGGQVAHRRSNRETPCAAIPAPHQRVHGVVRARVLKELHTSWPRINEDLRYQRRAARGKKGWCIPVVWRARRTLLRTCR